MATKLELLQEANRRGLLPPDKVALLGEFERRNPTQPVQQDMQEQPQKLPQERSVAGEIARPFLQTAKNIVVGTLGGAADIAQEAAYLPEALGRGAARGLGFDVDPFDYSKVNTASPMIRKAFDSATGGLTAPRSKGEEIIETVGEIAGGIVGPGAIKTAATKGADIASLIGKRTLQAGAGLKGKAQELVKAFEDAGVKPTLANIAEGQTTKTFQNILGNFPGSRGVIEKATQGQIDDITKQLAGITKSEGGTIQQTGKVIQEGALGIKEAGKARVSKLYDDLDQFIPKEAQSAFHGTPRPAGELKIGTSVGKFGESQLPGIYLSDSKEISRAFTGQLGDKGLLQTELTWKNPFRTTSKRQLADSLGFDDFDNNIDDITKVLKKRGHDGVIFKNNISFKGDTGSELVVFNPKDVKKVPLNSPSTSNKIPTTNLKALSQDPAIEDVVAVGSGDTAKVLARYNEIIDEAGNISYPRLKTFRSTIGAKLQSPSLLGEERGALKRIYGALSEDMKGAVQGEKGLQAFNKANNAFKRQSQLLDKVIDPLIEAKTPEKVYDLALSGTKQGGTNIRSIMRRLKPEQQEFVRGTVVNRMGLAQPGQQDAFGEVFSPNKFLTEWNRLSPEARTNIFTQPQLESINGLNKVTSALKETSKARQASNNLPYAAWAGLGGLTVASPAIAAGAVGGSNITARMMTNPRFVKWLAKTPKIRNAEIPKHLKQLSVISGSAKSPALSEDILDYIESITIEKGKNDNE